MLLTDYIEEQVTLASNLDASTTSVSVTLPSTTPPGWVEGTTVEFGTEMMYIFSVTGAGVATVQRGFRGSSPTNHSAGALGTIAPKFPTYRIFTALNDELQMLSSAQAGLFQMKSVELTFGSHQDGYDLTGVTDQILDIYQVTYDESGTEAAEPRLVNWRLRRDRNTSNFASGYALIVYDEAEAGRTMRVLYKTGFSALSSVSSALSSTGLHVEAHDLVPLGAALRLMTTRPIRREFLDEHGFSANRDEVPAGAMSASMRDLRDYYTMRVNAEATRLAQRYPAVYPRNGGRSSLTGGVIGRFS